MTQSHTEDFVDQIVTTDAQAADRYRPADIALAIRHIPGIEDKKERVHDSDLAKWLGYHSVYNLRRLIASMINADFGPVNYEEEQHVTTPNNGHRVQRTKAYWLTEMEVAAICARGTTERARIVMRNVLTAFANRKRSATLVQDNPPPDTSKEERAKAYIDYTVMVDLTNRLVSVGRMGTNEQANALAAFVRRSCGFDVSDFYKTDVGCERQEQLPEVEGPAEPKKLVSSSALVVEPNEAAVVPRVDTTGCYTAKAAGALLAKEFEQLRNVGRVNKKPLRPLANYGGYFADAMRALCLHPRPAEGYLVTDEIRKNAEPFVVMVPMKGATVDAGVNKDKVIEQVVFKPAAIQEVRAYIQRKLDGTDEAPVSSETPRPSVVSGLDPRRRIERKHAERHQQDRSGRERPRCSR